MADVKYEDALIDAYDEHARRIGKATILWNFAHSQIFAIFCELSGMKFEHAQAVYYSLKADLHQRDMVIALANSVLANDETARTKVVSAIKKFTALSNERNAIVHTVWNIPPPGQNIRANKLTKIFHEGYGGEDVAARMEAFNGKVSKASDELVKAFFEVLVFKAKMKEKS